MGRPENILRKAPGTYTDTWPPIGGLASAIVSLQLPPETIAGLDSIAGSRKQKTLIAFLGRA